MLTCFIILATSTLLKFKLLGFSLTKAQSSALVAALMHLNYVMHPFFTFAWYINS